MYEQKVENKLWQKGRGKESINKKKVREYIGLHDDGRRLPPRGKK